MKFKLLFLISLLFFFTIAFSNESYTETFENGWGDWYADAGTWEIGMPTSGPNNAFQGNNCAATVLDGNHAEIVNSRLISPYINVPSSEENPRLRFWHWYSFASYDYGTVQIRTKHSDWQTISPQYTNTSSNVWTYPLVDLSEWSDSTVQIGFFMHAQNHNGTSTGWYIDSVSLEVGNITFNNPETWEDGIGDWSSERGTWEIGTPTSGPNAAYQGESCAATVLDGKHAEIVDSRLISPYINVPSSEENPRLRFWHWYSFAPYDYGIVQIRTRYSDWQSISTQYTNTSSNVWTYPLVDLSEWSDSTVQIGFFMHAQNHNGTSTGWYIDSVSFSGVPEQYALKSGFSCDTSSGYPTLSVSFSDLSTPSDKVKSWKWDFNNDGTIDSEQQNPSFIYRTPGLFDVKLIVSDGIVSDTLVKQEYIEIKELVKADFMSDYTIGNLPLTINFEDKSTPASKVNSWKWDFDNDGIIDSHEQNPEFTFLSIGLYSVKLIVTNGERTDSITKEDFIRVNSASNSIVENSKAPFSIFPNPAEDVIFVRLDNANLYSKFEICNLLGEKIIMESIKQEMIQINIESFNNGIYILNIIGKNGAILSEILIKR